MQLAIIVTLVAIGFSVVVGVLGYLIDKSTDSAEASLKGTGTRR